MVSGHILQAPASPNPPLARSAETFSLTEYPQTRVFETSGRTYSFPRLRRAWASLACACQVSSILAGILVVIQKDFENASLRQILKAPSTPTLQAFPGGLQGARGQCRGSTHQGLGDTVLCLWHNELHTWDTVKEYKLSHPFPMAFFSPPPHPGPCQQRSSGELTHYLNQNLSPFFLFNSSAESYDTLPQFPPSD